MWPKSSETGRDGRTAGPEDACEQPSIGNIGRVETAAAARPILLLVGGPAGAGKSTLARAWCATRDRAVHVELDKQRHLIVAGCADPQRPGTLQSEQYTLGVRACLALARTFLDASYDVAIDDVLEPPTFERNWRPLLAGLD
jgi:predicted kinase